MSSVLSEAAVSSADWLRREEERLFGRYAVAAQRLPRLFRFRVPLVVAMYLLIAFVGQDLNGPGGDAFIFAGAGRTLVSSHWADTFTGSTLQSGPIFVLLEGIGYRLGSALGLPYWTGGGLVTALACALLMVVACRAVFAVYLLDGRTTAAREFGASIVFALTGGLWVVAMYAHPDDLLVTLLLLIAAARAATGRHGQAGVIFGLAVGVKLWALVAVAVLLVRASRRASAHAGLMAAATVAVCYGPFIVLGRFEMFHGSWQIEHDAPLNLLFRDGTGFTWQLRLLQAALATTVGLVVLFRTRGRDCAVWLVPAAAIAARLLVDPRNIAYYYPPVLVCLLLGQWASGRLTTFGSSLVTGAWMVVATCIFAITSGVVASWWVAVFCAGVIALAIRYGSSEVRSDQRQSQDPPVAT
jgi:hypothetical protein